VGLSRWFSRRGRHLQGRSGRTHRCRLLNIDGWILHDDRGRISVVGVVRVVPVGVRAPSPPVGRADTDEDAAPEVSVPAAAAPSLAGQDDAQDEGARDEKDRGNPFHAMAKASAQTQLLVKLRVVKPGPSGRMRARPITLRRWTSVWLGESWS